MKVDTLLSHPVVNSRWWNLWVLVKRTRHVVLMWMMRVLI